MNRENFVFFENLHRWRRRSSETAERSALVVINGNKLRQVFETNNHIGYRVLKGIGSVVARRLAAIEAKSGAHGGEST